MTSRSIVRASLVVIAGVLATGCMEKMTLEEMKAEMPERPAELDKLNAFVGDWEYEGTATMAMLDQPLESSGSSETKWDDEKRYVVSKHVFDMEGLGQMKGMETWTYDSHSKKYRSTWVDTMGSTGTGESTLDEKTNTWHMKATSFGPHGKTTMKGTVRFIDDDHMEWTWSEYMGWMKTMEMKGKAHRKP